MLQIFVILPVVLLGIVLGGENCLPVHAMPSEHLAQEVNIYNTSQPAKVLPWVAQTTLASTAVTLPPEIAKAVKKDLSHWKNIPLNQIKVQSATQQTWPNGCLGLARQDEICTQSMVSGWKIVVVSGKKSWTYRTGSTDKMIRRQP